MDLKTRFEESCKSNRLVGASLVVVKEDEIVEEQNFGYSSLDTKELVSSKTIFRIASISKIIVTMTVMSLAEEGKIKITDDIGDILGFPIRNPYYPDDKITISMLMTQTSSITDGFDDEDPKNEHEIKGYNGVNGTSWNVGLRELLVPNDSKYYSNGTWDKAKPGSKFIYSNFGCGILSCIVEAITNEYFTDYVEKRILRPLSLDASFRASNIKEKDKIATLYNTTNDIDNPYRVSRTKDSFILSGYPRFPLKENYRGPAGGLFISMQDLSKILRVLMNDGQYYGCRILKKETVDLMLQMHWFGNDDPTYLAKGLQLKMIDDFSNHLFIGHTGSAYGVVSELFFNLEEKIGLCFITNGGYFKNGKKKMTTIQEEVMEAFIENYFPKVEKKNQFTFSINSKVGDLNNHTILFESEAQLIDKEIYLPIKALARGLNLIPNFDNKGWFLTKNNFISYFDKENLVSVNCVCKELGIHLKVNDGKVMITY